MRLEAAVAALDRVEALSRRGFLIRAPAGAVIFPRAPDASTRGLRRPPEAAIVVMPFTGRRKGSAHDVHLVGKERLQR